MALQIVIISVLGLAIAQIIAVNKRKKIKKYFTAHQLSHILVCDTTAMKSLLEKSIDRSLYQGLEIVAIDRNSNTEEVQASSMFKSAVKSAGIMQLPCLLHYDGHEITGKFFETK